MHLNGERFNQELEQNNEEKRSIQAKHVKLFQQSFTNDSTMISSKNGRVLCNEGLSTYNRQGPRISPGSEKVSRLKEH
ncbi:hypothetical protein P8452_56466 [Trifolium repens]|nr:hypothetical protein P8452_56466 [Trifolium repens]